MDDALNRVLAPLLRDVGDAGVEWPVFTDSWRTGDPDWSVSFISPDGTDTPISVERGAPEAMMVAVLADQVQEWMVAELFPNAATNWPRCPHHPQTHPLKASTLGNVAVWLCPLDGTPIAPVGGLS